MKISSAFPSKYLRAADIPEGRTLGVTMDHVAIENVAGNNDPDDDKPVLYFQGKQKGMVLNKTNANTISSQYGDDTDEWKGGRIQIYASETAFGGKQVPCLRVKIERNGQTRQPAIAAPARPQPQPTTSPIGDEQVFNEDDIPF